MTNSALNTKDPLKAAIDNNVCGFCRVNRLPPPCPGHVLPDECGSGFGDDAPIQAAPDYSYVPPQKKPAIPDEEPIRTGSKLDLLKEWELLLNLYAGIFELQLGMLFISCDRLYGNLVMRPRPGLSGEDLALLKKFLELIKLEFNEFKEKLKEDHIPTKSFVTVIRENELLITIPNPKYFDAFMMLLARKNLLPLPHSAEQQKQHVYHPVADREPEKAADREPGKAFPTPFDDMLKGPRPKGEKKVIDL